MTVVSVSVLKAKLSEYLRHVQAGEQVTVTDRGKVIAQINPPSRAQGPNRERLEEMERQGLIRLGKGRVDPSVWDLPRPSLPGNTALEALLADREEGW